MKKFIEVHSPITETPYLLNTRNIMLVHKNEEGTMIDYGSNNWVTVKESYEQIKVMITEAENE